MPTLTTRHGAVHLTFHGQGSPLVLLHANPGDSRDYDAIVPELAKRHRVIAVDWPGYGASAAPTEDASAMSFAEIAIDLADALDLRDAIVMGNSVGGYAAVRLALERRERVGKLVLVDPGGFTPHNALTRFFCRLKGIEWVTRAIALAFAKRYLRARNEHVSAILERTDAGRHNREVVAVDAAVWRSFIRPEHDLRLSSRALTQPTLLAWGKHDPVLPLAKDGCEAKASISHATLATFDTGHMPFAEAPENFLATVLPFLALS
jgi:pimeloyl-ACP methyl ester carboxylesterase